MGLTNMTPPTLEQFDQELTKLSIEGYWNTIGVSSPEPKPRAEAHLWRWKDIYENLFKASEVVNLEDGAERRSLRLCTPGLPWRSTTETIQASVQMVLPGEVARAHSIPQRRYASSLKAVPVTPQSTANVMCCSPVTSC
jgi:gentisate 1,2-dioxygenase